MSFALTRKVDYALVALTRLAEEAEGGSEPLSAREIAEQFHLPQALLMNVLKDLHKAEIVCSRRGPSGGYMLCCSDPREVSMLQIVEAIDGPVKMALCCEDEGSHADPKDEPCVACRILDACPNVTAMQRFNELVRAFLSKITLKDLLDAPHRFVEIGSVAGSEVTT